MAVQDHVEHRHQCLPLHFKLWALVLTTNLESLRTHSTLAQTRNPHFEPYRKAAETEAKQLAARTSGKSKPQGLRFHALLDTCGRFCTLLDAFGHFGPRTVECSERCSVWSGRAAVHSLSQRRSPLPGPARGEIEVKAYTYPDPCADPTSGST